LFGVRTYSVPTRCHSACLFPGATTSEPKISTAENYSTWEIPVGLSEPLPKVEDDVPPYWAAYCISEDEVALKDWSLNVRAFFQDVACDSLALFLGGQLLGRLGYMCH
jgi:hypothetical protein